MQDFVHQPYQRLRRLCLNSVIRSILVRKVITQSRSLGFEVWGLGFAVGSVQVPGLGIRPPDIINGRSPSDSPNRVR